MEAQLNITAHMEPPNVSSFSSVSQRSLRECEWEILAPLIPPAKPGGRRRKWPVQRILNAVFFYFLRSGCQ
jgi:Putative transposase of IS4/5 family (DUF4096)